MSRFSLSVVIPAYNEKARLPKTLDLLLDFFRDPAFDAEIVVADDGSADETFAIAERYSRDWPMIRALTLKEHMGKGGALALGVQAARKDWILLYDADAAIPIVELRDFIQAVGSGFELLIGSRDVRGSSFVVRQHWLRKRLSRVFTLFRKVLVGLEEIQDTQCGFKLIRTALAKKIFSNLTTVGFLYDVEILARAKILGASILELGVQWEHVPESKVSVRRELPHILRQLWQIRSALKRFKKEQNAAASAT